MPWKWKHLWLVTFAQVIYGGVGKEKSNLCRYYKPRKHGMFEKNIRCLTVDKSKQHLNGKYLVWSNMAQMARYNRKLVMNIVMTVNKHSSQQGAYIGFYYWGSEVPLLSTWNQDSQDMSLTVTISMKSTSEHPIQEGRAAGYQKRAITLMQLDSDRFPFLPVPPHCFSRKLQQSCFKFPSV